MRENETGVRENKTACGKTRHHAGKMRRACKKTPTAGLREKKKRVCGKIETDMRENYGLGTTDVRENMRENT